MKRIISVAVAAICLSMLSPIGMGEADGPIRRMAQTWRGGKWTVAGGNVNIERHLAGAPHHIDTHGMTRAEMFRVHDRHHDVIGPVSFVGGNPTFYQSTVTRTACPGGCPNVSAVMSYPTVIQPPVVTTSYVDPFAVVVQEPQPPVREIVRYVERNPRVTERVVERETPTISSPHLPEPALTPQIVESRVREEMRGGDGFHRQMVKSIRTARQKKIITVKQSVRVRTALLSPAFRKEAQALVVTQMSFSGVHDTLVEYDENGNIVETAIDWSGFADFLERILPLIVDLLARFGLGG